MTQFLGFYKASCDLKMKLQNKSNNVSTGLLCFLTRFIAYTTFDECE